MNLELVRFQIKQQLEALLKIMKAGLVEKGMLQEEMM